MCNLLAGAAVIQYLYSVLSTVSGRIIVLFYFNWGGGGGYGDIMQTDRDDCPAY